MGWALQALQCMEFYLMYPLKANKGFDKSVQVIWCVSNIKLQTEERRTFAGHQWSMAFYLACATVLACKAKILVGSDWPSRSTWPCREVSLEITMVCQGGSISLWGSNRLEAAM
jgi:hypothetical protein